MQFVRIVWELLGTWRRLAITIVVTALVYEGTKLIGPYLVKEVIDTLVTVMSGDHAFFARVHAIERIALLLGAVLGIHFLQSGFDLGLTRTILRFLYGTERDVSCRASEHCSALTMSYHEREQAGNTITRIDRGCDKLLELLNDSLWHGIPTLLQAMVTTALIFSIDWRLGCLFVAFIPPFLGVVIRERRLVQPHRERRSLAYERSFGVLGESIWNMLTIQSFGNEDRRHAMYTAHRDEIVAEGRNQYRIEGRHSLAKNAIVNVGGVVMFGAMALQCMHGDLTIGSVYFLVTLVDKAYISLFNLGHLSSRIADAHESVMRLHAFLAEVPAVRDARDARTTVLTGGATYDHVTFAYPAADGRTAPVLRDVSCVIQPGETVAFAGPSGSGKSTFVKLLLRHYDIPEGSGTVHLTTTDGAHDARELARRPMRKQLGYVPQEGQLFSGTIAANIRFGNEGATDEEMRSAARLAGAEEFIADLPNGYDTVIGEQGVQLSGGQRQRLCIARAIVRKPAILVFDEATSHLDVESERVIQESLERLKGKMTVIVIAHRLSTIRGAHRIHFLENGEIIETGAHADLVRLGGRYARLAAIQAGDHRHEEHHRSPSGTDGSLIAASSSVA